MRKYNEYDGEDTSQRTGVQPHRVVLRKNKHHSYYATLDGDEEQADSLHHKYSRSERRNFIQLVNKIYIRPIVH